MCDQINKEFLISYMTIYSMSGGFLNLVSLIIFFTFYNNYSSVLSLFSLSLINLINSIFLVPFDLLKSLDLMPKNSIVCNFSYFFIYFLSIESELLLLILALERYRSILISNNSSNKLSRLIVKFNIKLATFLSFLVSALISIFTLIAYKFENNECKAIENSIEYFHICIMILYFLHLFSIIYIFIRIFYIAHKNLTRITSFKTTTTTSNNNNNINTCQLTGGVTTTNDLDNQFRSIMVEDIRITSKRIRVDLILAKYFILVKYFIFIKS